MAPRGCSADLIHTFQWVAARPPADPWLKLHWRAYYPQLLLVVGKGLSFSLVISNCARRTE